MQADLQQDGPRRPQPSRRAYYIIDRQQTNGIRCFRVWRRTAGKEQAELLSEHRHLAMAKSSVPVSWREATADDIEAWGFWQEDVLPENRSVFDPAG